MLADREKASLRAIQNQFAQLSNTKNGSSFVMVTGEGKAEFVKPDSQFYMLPIGTGRSRALWHWGLCSPPSHRDEVHLLRTHGRTAGRAVLDSARGGMGLDLPNNFEEDIWVMLTFVAAWQGLLPSMPGSALCWRTTANSSQPTAVFDCLPLVDGLESQIYVEPFEAAFDLVSLLLDDESCPMVLRTGWGDAQVKPVPKLYAEIEALSDEEIAVYILEKRHSKPFIETLRMEKDFVEMTEIELMKWPRTTVRRWVNNGDVDLVPGTRNVDRISLIEWAWKRWIPKARRS